MIYIARIMAVKTELTVIIMFYSSLSICIPKNSFVCFKKNQPVNNLVAVKGTITNSRLKLNSLKNQILNFIEAFYF